jgi:hypothetical protein
MRWLHYDGHPDRGWENTQPGWYECAVRVGTDHDHQKRAEILDWIYHNIELCERHARWIYSDSVMHVKFRYQRDHTWFVLRWGRT